MKYDLENRTKLFAKNTRDFLKKIPKTNSNFEYSKQLIRSSASVGANYIEANESLGKKDFLMRIRISRKEAKESSFWFDLIETKTPESELVRKNLLKESIELMKIFGAILQKSTS